ncbi:MAG: hypothetical protein ABW321_29875 [Polyangiales bacterium]
MSVPFTEIAGQKARLVWQVTGKAGPIDTPHGIRYLAPRAVEPELDGLRATRPDIAAAFSGIQVLLARGNLSLPPASLADVKRMSDNVETWLSEQPKPSLKLARILETLTATELKVGESRISGLLEHALHAAVRGSDVLDFEPFRDLAQGLQHFVEDAGIVRGIHTKSKLSSGTRASLRRVFDVVRSARWQAARWYNRTNDRPDQVWLCHADTDYWSDMEASFALGLDKSIVDQRMNLQVATFAAHRAVDKGFRANGPDGHLALQNALNLVYIQALMDNGLDEAAATATVTRVHGDLDGLEDDHQASRFLNEELTDEYVSAMVDAVRESTASVQQVCYPTALIDAVDDRDPSDILDDWRAFWLHGTDAGLIYKTYRECLGLRDGYAGAFEQTPRLSTVDIPDATPLLPPLVLDVDFEANGAREPDSWQRGRHAAASRSGSVRPLRSSMPVPRNRAKGVG